ncbi:GNAT family N-acetyltransferase [Nocardia sp. NPDC059240]|uniref:GNAT family N-acetyltransferase n=1 Tax=Nocardia sp. NPDC059240 TaxID=3346786 RepID=UPI0036CABA5E
MPILVEPTTRLHAAWLEAHTEWGPGHHEDGFGLQHSDDVTSPTGFATWVATLTTPPITCTYRWILDADRILGGIALRHYDTGLGHIGYGIRPTARRQGTASWALAAILPEAHSLGLTQVALVCAPDNLASIRTIERNSGVLQGIRTTPLGPARHYRIDLT